MKPDGVTATLADPTEVVVVPEPEPEANGQTLQDQSPALESETSENVQTEENTTVARSQKEVYGKKLDLQNKTKVPGKTKSNTTGTKVSNLSSGVSSRSAAVPGRVPYGVVKTASNSLAKKPVTSETKKTTLLRTGPQPRKGPSASGVESGTQVKAADRKPLWAAKPTVTSASSRTRSQTTTAMQSAASKKPLTTSSSTAVKPKAAASKPAPASTANPGVSTAPKAARIPKTSRPPTAPASRATTSTAPSKSTTTVTKSSGPKTTVTASAVQPASSKPSKVSSVIAKKDIKTSTSGTVVRKPLASITTCTTALKTSKPEPPKVGTAAKRLPTEPKNSQTKTGESRNVSTRKVYSSHPTLKNQQERGGNPVLKRQTRPTQSVSPLVMKSTKVSVLECAEPPAEFANVPSVAVAEVTVPAESLPEMLAPLEVELEQQPFQNPSDPVEAQRDEGFPKSDPSNVDMEQAITDVLAASMVTEEPSIVLSSPTAVNSEPESQKPIGAPMAPKLSQEPVIASISGLSVSAKVSTKGVDVEKSEQVIHSVEEEEEEEKECSQQVSVSDMSGTQPTEESRPGSAGFAGSVWRAGGLLSELDSEDVSCSQQGASELSAPGVLEGTESMDDLGEASLKGADGDGASVGSPDLEKLPDIPNIEDDDDHVCDMDVSSEMADDSNKHGHDNDDDNDVEMASEGITESGLESYGNADEDDFAEDYRLDNLNRMQTLSVLPSAASWGQTNISPDAYMKSPQPDPTFSAALFSNPWQADSESPTQEPAQTPLSVESPINEAPSLPDLPAPREPTPQSPQSQMQELDLCVKPDLTVLDGTMAWGFTVCDLDQTNIGSEKVMPEELLEQDFKTCSEINVNPVSVLPNIMQDHDSQVEELETLPADDKVACVVTAHTPVPSPGDEPSNTEAEMLISKPNIETRSTGNEISESKQDVSSLSASGECEETCVELEVGGDGDTPQSVTSGASYGFNSNAQSSTESCTKSPGIFSLDNEEQLPDEAKDPSTIKVFTDDDVLDPAQQSEIQLNTEPQYIFCRKPSDELPDAATLEGAAPTEIRLNSTFSIQHQEDWDLNAPHPCFSTISKNTDTSLQGRVRPPKHHNRPRVDHVIHFPELPTNLPPKMPSLRKNAQLARLEHHQLQLQVINQKLEQQSKCVKSPKACVQVDVTVEKNMWGKGPDEQRTCQEHENELEKQRRDLLQLQIQQQEQELKQRQQLVQWQEELRQQQSKLHNRSNNAMTPVLSPSGLGTIYETLETSDSEENYENERSGDIIDKVKKESFHTKTSPGTNPNASPQVDDALRSESTAMPLDPEEKQGSTFSSVTHSSPLLKSTPPQCPFPLEMHWVKRANLVQQLINQTLLVAGSNCSPRLLLPEGVAGTLSPLETTLWPNLAQLGSSSATVTSVSSFSPEISDSSPQGEWTVVELETHH